jgi:hypothetical protein
LAENIYEAVEDAVVFGDVDYHDLDGASDNVVRLLQRWLDKRQIGYSGYDLREISESFDLRERRAGYYGEERSAGYRPTGGTSAVPSLDEIDDLFDRA